MWLALLYDDLNALHIHITIFKHFSPLVHNFTNEYFVSVLGSYALMNLYTWYTFCPQETDDRLLLILKTMLKLHCHIHYFRSNSHTNCKVNKLALTTAHMTPYITSHPHLFHSFSFLRKCKSGGSLIISFPLVSLKMFSFPSSKSKSQILHLAFKELFEYIHNKSNMNI